MAVKFGGKRDGQLDMGAAEPAKVAFNQEFPDTNLGTPIEVEEAQQVVTTPHVEMVAAPAVVKHGAKVTDIAPFVPGGSLAFFDFQNDPFALFDFNGADGALGQALPMRRIEYCASKGTESLRKGQITDMATMEQKPSVRAVLVAMKFSRVWMPDYDPTAESNEPLCVSLDGSRRTKGMNTRVPEEQLCAECPHAKWAPGAKHPDCSEVYTLLMLDVDDSDTPFLFNLRRTGIKPLRTFRNALKATALRVWTAASGVPANLCAEFTLAATPEKNFYLPTFTDLKAVSLERARELASRLAPIIQTFNKAETAEAMLAADGAFDDDGEPARVSVKEDAYVPPAEEYAPVVAGGAGRKFGSR